VQQGCSAVMLTAELLAIGRRHPCPLIDDPCPPLQASLLPPIKSAPQICRSQRRQRVDAHTRRPVLLGTQKSWHVGKPLRTLQLSTYYRDRAGRDWSDVRTAYSAGILPTDVLLVAFTGLTGLRGCPLLTRYTVELVTNTKPHRHAFASN
jgi:hypothetical protein